MRGARAKRVKTVKEGTLVATVDTYLLPPGHLFYLWAVG
jgi:hypothetical protein